MKSILLSIKPKYVELIASGKKTIEVRKSAPQEVPFKAYIYCTYGNPKENYALRKQGKVIGEFILEMQILSPTFLQPVRSLEYVEGQCKKIVDQLEVVDNIYDKNKDADASTEFLKAVDPFSVYHNF